MDIIKLLEDDIAKKHLSQHPFYQLWNEGNVPIKALQAYAQQYFAFVKEFPRFVSRVHSNTPEEADRILILENLYEEENPKLPHSKLWIQFAEGIGVKNINAKFLPETQKMLDELKILSNKSFTEGCAALLAYEAQIPEIATLKMDGLKKHYGMKSKKALHFFEEHSVVDLEHQKTWKQIIKRNAKTKSEKIKVRKALNRSLDAMWKMLDGVQRAHCAA